VSLLESTIKQVVAQDPDARAKARARLEQLTMPHWALGRLMDLAEDLAGMTRSMHPPVGRKTVTVMAADHGVTAEGVSKYPQEVTAQMVRNFVEGGAGINALARLAAARVVVVDMGVAGDLSALADEGKILCRRMGAGTGNIARGPAMSRDDAVRCIEAGIEVARDLDRDTDLFATGDMGIGNSTASAAVIAAITGRPTGEVVGRGAGLDDDQLANKIKVVERCLEVNQPDPADGIDLLAKIGGFEIGGISGLVLGAAARQKPVLVDGFASTAGALIAQCLAPHVTDYVICAHLSAERGHGAALERLGKEPLLDLDLRLGEGTGAALTMNLVEAAVRVLTEVATFEEASVSRANQ
jgi:nicotinate-nucleotide--dimethylbenzimidazole phosphoribosyltransferase